MSEGSDNSFKEPLKELRIGIVLYGGVSLAVYMNGIVTELWNVLRASQARSDETDRHAAVAALTGSTASIYAELLGALAKLERSENLRVVVDAVAGSSAGGLNGAVLAKAIVDGGDASVLNRVWIDDAQLGKDKLCPEPIVQAPKGLRWIGYLPGPASRFRKLLTSKLRLDWDWICSQAYGFLTTKDGAATVLDGRYFARMIAKAFRDMAAKPTKPLLPHGGTFDLFLTRTDFHGWPRHLPVSEQFHPRPLYERTHAHQMHFRRGYRGGPFNDDFGLTYATRTTAGFPIAFAPVSYRSVAQLYKEARGEEAMPPEEFLRRHLPEHRLAQFPANQAWMIDGGVLDNKPFSYVADAIEDKPADHEVFRIVMYVEPDPELTPKPEADGNPEPLPMKIAAGLYALFRDEPIYDDLRRLDERNSKVTLIQNFLDANASSIREGPRDARIPDFSQTIPPSEGDLERWREAANDYVAGNPVLGAAGYEALKARRAVDVLAQLVCNALDYPYPSRHAYFVRRLLRTWFEQKRVLGADPIDTQARRRLLAAFDVPFRLRRLRHLARAMRPGYATLATDTRERRAARAVLDGFKQKLATSAAAYQAALEAAADVKAELQDVLGRDIEAAIEQNDFDVGQVILRHAPLLRNVYDWLADRFTQLGTDQNKQLVRAIVALRGDPLRWAAEAYINFIFTDLIAFPLMDAARIDDLVLVNTMRISPRDVNRLDARMKRQGRQRAPLAGAALGAFAGFVDRTAREGDLLWGRLDGAERLIELIVAAAAVSKDDVARLQGLREEYTGRVMQQILAMEAERPGVSRDLQQLASDLKAIA
jgi:patatin-related protein